MKLSKQFTSMCFLVLAQVMVGTNIVGSKYLLTSYAPGLILTTRYLTAAILLCVIHLVFERKKANKGYLTLSKLTKKDWKFLFAQGLCAGLLFNFLLYLGMQYTSASMAGIITSALPAIIVILSLVIFKDKLNRRNTICLVLTITGLVIINAQKLGFTGLHLWLGDMLILLSLLPEASYYLLTKMYRVKLPLFLYATLLTACNVPFLLLWLVLQKHINLHLSAFTLKDGFAFIAVSLSSGLFFVFWVVGCQKVSNTSSAMMTAVMPIATLIIARIFLGETISNLQFIGMLFIITSIFVFAQNKKATK